MDDSSCSPDSLKSDNRHYIDAFTREGEQVLLIEDDFEASLQHLIQKFSPKMPLDIG